MTATFTADRFPCQYPPVDTLRCVTNAERESLYRIIHSWPQQAYDEVVEIAAANADADEPADREQYIADEIMDEALQEYAVFNPPAIPDLPAPLPVRLRRAARRVLATLAHSLPGGTR